MDERWYKETDQSDAQRAFELLQKCMHDHRDIKPYVWAASFWSVLVNGYVNSEVSYDEFCNEWENVKIHYKVWFDE